MNLSVYDKGVLEKFREVFDNSVLAQSDSAFRTAEELLGEVKLPLISIYREDFNIKPARFNIGQRMRGSSIVSKTEDDSEIKAIQDIPLDISYQIDIWTRRKEDIDIIVPEVVFWLVDNPNISIDVDGIDHEIEFPLVLDEDVSDNTDIMSFENKGRIFRITLSANITDARIFAFKDVKTVLTTDIEYEVLDNLEDMPE